MLKEQMQSLKRTIRPLIPELVLQRWRMSLSVQRRAADRAGLKLVVRDLFFDLIKGDTVLRVRRAHLIYLQHMIENFDYFTDSVIPFQADGVKLVDMSGPRFHRLRGFADIPFLFPSHSEPYGTTAEYLDFAGLQNGNIVLDIGAYAGVTSIILRNGSVLTVTCMPSKPMG